MALRSIVDSLDEVPAEFHSEYKPLDGKFVLDVDGIDSHPQVAKLKSAFERVKADKTKLSADLAEAVAKTAELPEDFDAEEWVRLKAAAGDPKDPAKQDEHLQSQKRVFEQRISNLEAKHAKDLATAQAEIQERDGALNGLLVEEGLTKALAEAGVAKEYLKAARALLRPSVKVVRDENGSRRAIVETDLGEEEVARYVASWTQSDEGRVFIPKPTGSDANGTGGRGFTDNPWDSSGGKKPNLTKQQELIATAPERARQMAKAAGVTPNW